jgi:hypothetical protein
MDFKYLPHPRTEARLKGTAAPPTKVADQHADSVNGRVALWITDHVGTMGCAYLFTIIALISLPTILKQAGFGIGFDFGDSTVAIIAWIAQTFLQLVLLSVIMVGQDVQSKAADKRAESTYKDAEAVLHEATQIQAHLAEQDKVLADIIAKASGAAPAN